jgi:flagellar hook-associated protein 3 FlgL
MRLSTALIENMGTKGITNQQAKLAKTQLQISSSLRILTPSDDPVGSVRALDLDASLDTYTQYQTNIKTTLSRLASEDGSLEEANNILQRARELTVQSLNDTLGDSDRKAISQEIQQLLDHMLEVSNTRNPNGEYMFAGDRSTTVPFVFDGTRTPPSYVFQGENSQRLIQVGTEYPMADGNSGFEVFEDVPSNSGSTALAAAGGRQNILNTLLSLKDALTGEFTASHGAVLGSKDLSTGIDYSENSVAFDLTIDDVGTESITIDANRYTSADELTAAINAGIRDSGLNGRVVAQNRGGSIEFASTSQGPNSQVTIGNNSSGVLTDLGFTEAQIGQGADVTFHDAGNAALTDLDHAIQKILDTRASVGARLNALDTQDQLYSKFVVDTKAGLSDIQDLDYIEAISRFNLQQVALQAAQQSYVKVQGLSLFDYLR